MCKCAHVSVSRDVIAHHIISLITVSGTILTLKVLINTCFWHLKGGDDIGRSWRFWFTDFLLIIIRYALKKIKVIILSFEAVYALLIKKQTNKHSNF